MRPLGAYTPPDAKNVPKIVEIYSKKSQYMMLSKLPKSKNTLENISQEANRAKMTMKPKHIDLKAILEPF